MRGFSIVLSKPMKISPIARSFHAAGAFAVILALHGPSEAFAAPARAEIVKTGDAAWELRVNGEPFYVRGAGVGRAFGKNGENYLEMAKNMGANVVRTWGADQGDRKYLDEARRQGLYVNAGIWLEHVGPKHSYLPGSPYPDEAEKKALEYVRQFKDHPAILMWNVGNEVIAKTPSEAERDAFAQFLERVTRAIKAIDSNHPVIYADSGHIALPYLKSYALSLDAVGFNIYGSVIVSESAWRNIRFEAPYIVTEFGPHGPWDLVKDSFGRTAEEGDYSKAAQYRNHWKLLAERRGANIGGFAFHLGETTQESLSFWNLNDGKYPKESFLMMQGLYTGSPAANHSPRIETLKLTPSAVKPGAAFRAQAKAADPEGGAIRYEYFASTAIEGVEKYEVNSVLPLNGPDAPSAELKAPRDPGLYRVYVRALDAEGNSALKNAVLRVDR